MFNISDPKQHYSRDFGGSWFGRLGRIRRRRHYVWFSHLNYREINKLATDRIIEDEFWFNRLFTKHQIKVCLFKYYIFINIFTMHNEENLTSSYTSND